MEATVMIALLQPAQKVTWYITALELKSFFGSLGFQLPRSKWDADFLQDVFMSKIVLSFDFFKMLALLDFCQVTSKKDQIQYWADPSRPYEFIPVSKITKKNSKFQIC
ncbi:hypothetical protein CFOL_v3_33320 [Cephalotus follicularis]|uniref:Uncharacterized protein n=1 Tax=Cephalotus follicularis TaxID=3775 RepID=A0A1Q3DCC4_CEPFO|nr:hypothetical protein CFOL_v3_33320 [Cephalotus follicularis]